MVWENRHEILDEQIYVFAKQFRRISRLRDKVDYVVVDSPLLMCCMYMTEGYFPSLEPLIVEVMTSFENHNFVLNRSVDYIEYGRNQTEAEAIVLDQTIKDLLNMYDEPFTLIDINNNPASVIVNQIHS